MTLDTAPGRADAMGSAAPGDTIARRYRLVRCIGRGSSGQVFEAVHTTTGRRVALKLIASLPGTVADARRRFAREARLPAGLSHPNVVDVLDAGEDPERGTLFIAHTLLEGEDLRTRFADRDARPLSAHDALTLLLPIADALAAAHARAIVHRDVKPANVFLARDAAGRVVPTLIDFGIARGDEATVTRSQIGTPAYMAPEQIVDGVVGPQVDAWAFAVVLYEALAPGRPFEAANSHALLFRIANGPPAARLRGGPDALADVLQRALERDPAQRFQSIAALRDALRATSVNGSPPVAAVVNRARTRWQPGRRVAMGGAGLLLALALAAGVRAWRSRNDDALALQLRAVMTSQIPHVQRCFDRVLADHPALHGHGVTTHLRVTIDERGAVLDARASDLVAWPGLESCVTSELRELRFPATGRRTTLRYPVRFTE